MEDIKEKYDSVMEEYVSKFKDMYFHDVPCEGFWVDDDPGGVYYINDYYLDFKTIKYAVDNKVGETEFFSWYDNTMRQVQDWCDGNPPTLEDWWDGRNDQSWIADWELDTYRCKIFVFPGELGFVQAQGPSYNGWYAVILCGQNGIIQDVWQWQDGKWLNQPEHEESVLILARSRNPLVLKHLKEENAAKTD